MIKIKNMTVEADGTGGMDFTFDSPEDLARLWSLNGSSGVEITGDIKIHVMEDGNLKAALADIGAHEHVSSRTYLGPVLPAPQTKPPIPLDVYYSDGHFFHQITRNSMGGVFYSMWIDRAHEFPTAHAYRK